MFVLPTMYRARGSELLDDVRVVWGSKTLEDAATRGGLLPLGHDQVLERDRDAEQRRQRRECLEPSPAGRREPHIGGHGACPGAGSVDREPGMDGSVDLLDGSEMRVEQFHGAVRHRRASQRPSRGRADGSDSHHSP